MKAIIEFNMNDPEERIEHLRMIMSDQMASVIWEMTHNLVRRTEAKTPYDQQSDDWHAGVDAVISEMAQIIKEEGMIDIDEIWN